MAKKETTTKKATAKKTTTKKDTAKKDKLKIDNSEPVVMNGDPSVLTDPVTDYGAVAEPLREKQKEIKPAKEEVYVINPQIVVAEEVKPAKKKEEENPHEVSSLVAEEIVNDSQPEEYDSAKPAKQKRVNNPTSHVKKILGYFWNGIEMDY